MKHLAKVTIPMLYSGTPDEGDHDKGDYANVDHAYVVQWNT